MKEEKNRFDLEQEIMGVWHIIDDLRVLLDNFDTLTEDKKLNILIGLVDLYDMKFNDMFSTFETCIAKQEFKSLDQRLSSYEQFLNREYGEDIARKYGAQC